MTSWLSRTLQFVLVTLVVLGTTHHSAVSQTTGFTYQGRLDLNGVPVNQACNFQFSLWDGPGSGLPPTGGTPVGSAQTLNNVSVQNGVFTVELNSGGQFGATAFTGSDRWLQASVTCPPAVTVVLPRQRVSPTPYALHAFSAGSATDLTCTGCVGGSDLGPNAVTSDKIQDGAVAPGDTSFNYAGSTSKGGPATSLECASACVSGAEIAAGQVVRSLNGLTDALTLQAGTNVTITPAGNTLTIASTGGSLVSHDATLTGNGTGGSPLAVSYPLGLGAPADASTPLRAAGRIASGISGSAAGAMTFYPPDGFAWFHLDNGPSGRTTGRLRFSTGGSPGAQPEIMSLLQNGNVGIGTSAPAAKLDVNGNLRIACGSRIYLGGGDGEWITQPCQASDPNFPIEIFTAFQKRVRIENTGRVDIYSGYFDCFGFPVASGVALLPGFNEWLPLGVCIGAEPQPSGGGPSNPRPPKVGGPQRTDGSAGSGDPTKSAAKHERGLGPRGRLRAQQQQIEALAQRVAELERALALASAAGGGQLRALEADQR